MGLFDTGIFDTGIFDHQVDAGQDSAGGNWRPAEFHYRRTATGRARIELDGMRMVATGELRGQSMNQRQWLTLQALTKEQMYA